MAKLTTDLLKNAMPEPGKRLEFRDDDEGGLIFRVTDKGKRSWSLRYVNAAGEHRRQLIGPFPSINLSKARDEARKIKGAVAVGSDLVGDAKRAKALEDAKRLRTLEGLAEAYFADAEIGLHRTNARGAKRSSTLKEEHRIFEKLVKPTLGALPVSDIKRADIQALVTKLSKGAVSNGRIARNLIRQLMGYALSHEVIEANPAHDIAVVLPPPRERTLTDAELRAVWSACSAPATIKGPALSREMGIAIQLAMVTLQRGGEVIGMQWVEIDRERRLWVIPAIRMKGKRSHAVPLSDLALELLDAAKDLIGGKTYVFQSSRTADGETHFERRAFSRAMNRLTSSLKIDNATPHDMRRTGATNITSERIGIPRFIVSQVLAHAGDTGGSAAVTGRHYDLNDYLPEKRRALDAWSALLREILGMTDRARNVTKLQTGAVG